MMSSSQGFGLGDDVHIAGVERGVVLDVNVSAPGPVDMLERFSLGDCGVPRGIEHARA